MFIELVTFATSIPMMDNDMQNIVPEPVLIQQLKASSEKAFDEIYNLYAGRLYTFCMKVSVSAMLVDTRQKKYRSSFYS